jgi:chemotaxis protein histidine kinase CheA
MCNWYGKNVGDDMVAIKVLYSARTVKEFCEGTGRAGSVPDYCKACAFTLEKLGGAGDEVVALNSLEARVTAQAEADKADIQPPDAEVFATAAGKSINVLVSGQVCGISDRDWSLHAWLVVTITGVPARLQSLRYLKWCDPKDFKLEEHTKDMASLMHLGDSKYRVVLGNHGPASPGQAKTKTSFPLDITLCEKGKFESINLAKTCLDSRKACEAFTLLRSQRGCTPGSFVFARDNDGKHELPKNAASEFFAQMTSSSVGELRNRIETDADSLVKAEKLSEADASFVTKLLQHTPKTRERNYVARSRSPTSAAAASAASTSAAAASAASASAAAAAADSQTSSDEELPPSTNETNSNDTVTATAASVATQTEEIDWIAAVAGETKRLFRGDDSALVNLNCAIALAEFEGDLSNERAKRMLSRATAACDMAMDQARKRPRLNRPQAGGRRVAWSDDEDSEDF